MAEKVQTNTPAAGANASPLADLDREGRIRIGRAADNHILLADPLVSAHHAEIRRHGAEIVLVDLNSSFGVHHNGRRVKGNVPLADGDEFAISRHEFQIRGGDLFQHDDEGPTSIFADEVSLRPKRAKKPLLHNVTFPLQQGHLLGIVGPSGCGKSTLLRAMTGSWAPDMGSVLYSGKDLYQNFSELRTRIGLVPQDDVMHRQLTVRRALRFAASLRFSQDYRRRERLRRVKEVTQLLGLEEREGARIDKLSGGQRKRASVALEMLTKPSLLALDEPTSGLDPNLDKEVMLELRRIALEGKTVIVVTHSVLHLDLCDRVLVMCVGGKLGYFGPPDGARPFFEAGLRDLARQGLLEYGEDQTADWADVFREVTMRPDYWKNRFLGSAEHRRYVLEQPDYLGAVPAPRPNPVTLGGTATAVAEETAAPAGQPAPEEPVLNVVAPMLVAVAKLPIAPRTGQPGQAELTAAGIAALKTSPAQSAPAQSAPAQAVPAQAVPAQDAATQDAATQDAATQAAPMPAAAPARPPQSASWIDRLADRIIPDSKPKPTVAAAAPEGPQTVFQDTAVKPKQGPAGVQEQSLARSALHPLKPLRQFFTLCTRMIAVILADKGYAAFLLTLPLALGALAHTVPGGKGLGPDPEGYSLEAQRLLIVLVTGAAFMGVAIAIREIVNEGTIYRRERAVGLSPTAYLFSKLVIFLVIDVIQVALFVYVSLWGRAGPAEGLVFGNATYEIIFAVALVAFASTALGLLASALVRTSEQTTPIMVVTVMAQLVLCGGLFEISGQTALEIVSWVDPSRWGFAAAASTTNLLNFPFIDDMWSHETGHWWRVVAVLVGQIVLLTVATRIALRRFEPGHS